jgi:hypothetical protein
MRRTHLGSSAMLLLSAGIAINCGGMRSMGADPNRTLLSISVSPSSATTSAAGQIQFVATGIFSQAPLTVTPLPANWSGNWSGVPLYCFSDGCAGMNPRGLAICFGNTPGVTITASAPSDPMLPLGSKNVPTVSGTATLNCE